MSLVKIYRTLLDRQENSPSVMQGWVKANRGIFIKADYTVKHVRITWKSLISGDAQPVELPQAQVSSTFGSSEGRFTDFESLPPCAV